MGQNDFKENIRALRFFFRYSVFPNNTLTQLGIILSGISVLALVSHAFDVGFSVVFEGVVSWYNTFLSLTIGWLQYPIRWVIEAIAGWFSVPFILHEHWKHIFIVSNVYFLRNTFSYTKSTEDGSSVRDLPVTIYIGILSIIISTVVCGIVGVIEPKDAWSNLLVAWIPLLGFFVYDVLERSISVLWLAQDSAYSKFGMTRRTAYARYMGRAIERFAGITVFSILLVLIFSQIKRRKIF